MQDGFTPLMLAASNGNTEVVRVLVTAFEVDVSRVDEVRF